jgi:response regulator RpfG family c-di-GMP phosphodiesterase
MCRFAALLTSQLVSWYPDMDRAWIDIARTVATLHDVGNVGIPDAVLRPMLVAE